MNSKNNYPSFVKILILTAAIFAASCFMKHFGGTGIQNSVDKMISDYSAANGYKISDYPAEIVDMLRQNEETKDFVLEYPAHSDEKSVKKQVDLSEYADADTVPLLMQWDRRWGYAGYGNGVIGTDGSAPTCLSMAAIYILGSTQISPLTAADISIENGWVNRPELLLSEGARAFGINVREMPQSENSFKSAIDSGKVLAVLTDSKLLGQAVIVYAYNEDGFLLNDPMSAERSGKIYKYSEIYKHIRNVWAYGK